MPPSAETFPVNDIVLVMLEGGREGERVGMFWGTWTSTSAS